MRRVAPVGLLLLVCACSEIPASPTAAPSIKTEVIATRITLVPSPAQLPVGGGTLRITVGVSGGGGALPAPGVRVTLNASSGTLDRGEVVTDSSGYGRVDWTGSESATLTGTAGDLSTSVVLMVAPAPSVPPLSSPPPPAPVPQPPAPVLPALAVTVTPAAASVLMNTAQTYTAATTNLDAGETVISYAWIFETPGGSVPGGGRVQSYTYTTDGAKTPQVTVLTSAGRTATGSGTVTVTPPPALTVTVTPPAATVPTNTSQTYTAVVANLNSGETVTSYAWIFEDPNGSVPSGGRMQSYTYTTEGTKTPQVTVLTSAGRRQTGSGTVSVVTPALSVTLTFPQAVINVGLTQRYTATVANLQPTETIQAYTWTFDADATVTSAGNTRDYAFPKDGEKKVTVKAISSTGRTATGTGTLIVTTPLR